MSGHLGNDRITMQNLTVYKIDYKRNLLYIKGSVPGHDYSLVEIVDAKKNYVQYSKVPYPTFLSEKGISIPDVQEWTETKDLNEVYQHDNDEILGVSEEEEEGEPEKTAEDDMTIKK